MIGASIAVANVVAIALDMLSVHLGEYRLSYAMLDVPVEALSLLLMLIFLAKYPAYRRQTVEASSGTALDGSTSTGIPSRSQSGDCRRSGDAPPRW